MQEIINTGWPLILIISLVVGIAHFGLNKEHARLSFPHQMLPLIIVSAIVFFVPLYLFNPDINFHYLAASYVAGILVCMIIQCYLPKVELTMGIVCFLAVFLAYKFLPDNLILCTGLFSVGLFSGLVLRLLRAEKFLGNLLVASAVILPLYTGITWLKVLNLTGPELDKRMFLLFVTAAIAFCYAFGLTFLKNDKYAFKRQGALVVAALVIYLVLNNFLEVSVNFIYLVVAGFVLAQIFDSFEIKSYFDVKTTTLNAVAAFGIVLLVGFILTRIFGIWGLILVSVCMLATASHNAERLLNWPVIASLFFSIKALVHIFVNQTTLNVTGLNLNHPYVYVGLIIGFVVPFIILAATAAYKTRFVSFNLITLILFALMLPLMACYILHAEAAGAMILSMSISSLVVAVGGKIAGKELDNKQSQLVANAILPLTALSGLMILFSQELITWGNLATREARAATFIAISVISVILVLALFKVEDRGPEEFYPEHEPELDA